MSESIHSDVSVYVCRHCLPEGRHVPRQWTQDGVHVQVTELPCSGKTDTQYLLHAIEGGAQGVLVVTCAKGECRLSQGNYRAEIRIRTVQRLLAEIGMEPERAAIVQCPEGADVEMLIHDSVKQFAALAKNPICAPC
ncbi:MAG TPA: hydrogenase iron-sulfur subunit [Candidatus Hydrogenedentes bacterium]|nr:hydrogenase iron-sulfur subunit [Candidatus Hydrogenedentota bacterium]